MFSNKNFYIFFIIIILLISSQSKKQIMLLDGDDLDSQINLSSKSNTKLFLIFYVEHCIYCSHALKILKEKIVKNFEDEDEISFGVINLDDQKNVWTGLRFNISRIPYVILIEKDKMYYYQNAFEENLVMKFINEEKNIEDALDIPDDVGLSQKINFFMAGLIRQISDFFIRFGFNNNTSNILACVLLFIFLVIMIYLEHKLINGIRKLIDYFGNRKKNKENNNKETLDEKKNEEGDIKDKNE